MVFPKPFLTTFVTYSNRVVHSIVGRVISSTDRISELTRTTVSATKTIVSSNERYAELVGTVQSKIGIVVSSVDRVTELTLIQISKTRIITSVATRTVELLKDVSSKTGVVVSFVESVKITLYPQPIVFRKTFPMRFSSMHMADRSAQSYVGIIVSFVTKRGDVLYDIYEDTPMYCVELDTMMYEVLIE